MAKSALAVDLDSGKVLYEKNSDEPLLPASTTKIVTALVSLDSYPLNQVIKVENVSVDGQKMGLVPGEEIKVEDLIYGLLIASANDAAEVLAYNFPGGRDFFVAAMNAKANILGLKNTFFTNPTGLDQSGQITTAKDLVDISTFAMKNPVFSNAVSTKGITVKSIDGKYTHKLTNVNQLLGRVNGVLGVKTGWTEEAGGNLVSYVERNNKKIMIAVLGSQDRFGETKILIDWVFNNYNYGVDVGD